MSPVVLKACKAKAGRMFVKANLPENVCVVSAASDALANALA